MSEDSARKTASALLGRLFSEDALLASVESCTGGLIAHLLTEIPGSSAAFWGSWVTYQDCAKMALGVLPETLARHGAVSLEVSREMAAAGLLRMKTALGNPERKLLILSTTGLAGPGQDSMLPRGLCFIGIAGSGIPAESHPICAPAALTRSEMKLFFAEQAMHILLKIWLKNME